MGMAGGGGRMQKTTKKCHTINKSLIKHYLKTVYKMISKSKFFYCHTYEFDFSGVVEG